MEYGSWFVDDSNESPEFVAVQLGAFQVEMDYFRSPASFRAREATSRAIETFDATASTLLRCIVEPGLKLQASAVRTLHELYELPSNPHTDAIHAKIGQFIVHSRSALMETFGGDCNHIDITAHQQLFAIIDDFEGQEAA